jgi:hypothetical protein
MAWERGRLFAGPCCVPPGSHGIDALVDALTARLRLDLLDRSGIG